MADDRRTVVFMPESAYGPTNNCIGIGHLLERRGHRVVFAAESSWKGKLEPLGFEERLVELAPPSGEEQDAGQFWTDFIIETAPEFRKPTLEQLESFIKPVWQSLMDGARYCEPQLQSILSDVQPDAIVEDNVNGEFQWLLQHLCHQYGSEVVRMPGPRLSIGERDFIQAGLRAEMSCRGIAAELGRSPSTVSREIQRNRGLRGYRSCVAHYRAHQRARRPKAFKLERHPELARCVERLLRRRWSPEQVAARLRRDHPDDPRWWVSPEAIYRALYVQARGAMRHELQRYLRSGRARRKPHHDNKRGRLKDMVMIADRPPEVDDRAVPGHWEGDLLFGTGGHSQVGMVTERTTRFTMLFALPYDRTAPTVRRALGRTIRRLPAHLARTVTWDQGSELAEHSRFTIDSQVDVFFCDPASPWQRGTAENTVGLLRQYLPKNADLSRVSQRQLDRMAAELNERPRKILGWDSPAETYARVLGVATTD